MRKRGFALFTARAILETGVESDQKSILAVVTGFGEEKKRERNDQSKAKISKVLHQGLLKLQEAD